jgi:hypothetical protein
MSGYCPIYQDPVELRGGFWTSDASRQLGFHISMQIWGIPFPKFIGFMQCEFVLYLLLHHLVVQLSRLLVAIPP